MCKLILTAGLCVVIASLGLPGLGVLADNFCYGRPNGDYPHPYYNQYFITCAHDIDHYIPCPSNLVYNPTSKVCDHPPETTNGNFCDGKDEGNHVNPYDEHSFITCSHGTVSVQQCPADLVYNPDKEVCDYTAETTYGNYCDGLDDGDIPHPYDENSYITCAHGIDDVKQCQGDLVYNPDTKVCDYAAQSNFYGNYCYGLPDGDYEHPYYLHSFITCAHGLDHFIQCPGYLVYNPTIKVCDYAINGNFCARRRDGNFRNRADRYTFISCSGGITYIQQCPAGLVYRKRKDKCLYPQNYYN